MCLDGNPTLSAFIIRKLIKSITSLGENENGHLFGILARVNTTNEWMWRIYLKCTCATLIGVSVLGLISILYSFSVRGQFDVNYAIHLYRFT